jgi:hypothetical protein
MTNGAKGCQVACSLPEKQASADERMTLAMEMHVESHKDYLHYKIMSKMGDSEIVNRQSSSSGFSF